MSDWKKSSFCNGATACVEVKPLDDGTIGVRDSKNPEGPVLSVTPDVWQDFIDTLK